MANYRNRQLLDLAHRMEQCMSCGAYTPGCEPAHSNQQVHGKGMSIKAHDCFHAALCHDCHSRLDQGGGDRSAKQLLWLGAFERTLLEYFKRGWIKVA